MDWPLVLELYGGVGLFTCWLFTVGDFAEGWAAEARKRRHPQWTIYCGAAFLAVAWPMVYGALAYWTAEHFVKAWLRRPWARR